MRPTDCIGYTDHTFQTVLIQKFLMLHRDFGKGEGSVKILEKDWKISERRKGISGEKQILKIFVFHLHLRKDGV